MSREQWRASLIMFVVGFTIVLLVLALTYRAGAPYSASNIVTMARVVTVTPNPAEANQVLAPESIGLQVSAPLPPQDASGLRDDPDVPRFPGAVLVKRHDTAMVHELNYISIGRPMDIGEFYANYAYNQLGMGYRQYTKFGGRENGYHMIYGSKDNSASLILFALSEHLDLPSGGTQNPTHIDLMIVGQVKALNQPTPTMPPTWLTPETWNAPRVTVTPSPQR